MDKRDSALVCFNCYGGVVKGEVNLYFERFGGAKTATCCLCRRTFVPDNTNDHSIYRQLIASMPDDLAIRVLNALSK